MSGVETTLSPAEGATLAGVADHLIPAAEGMPSAAEVVDAARVSFVLRSRPDLEAPLRAALRPGLGSDVAARLATLTAVDPDSLAALQLVIVGGYYTDRRVRELIGYPGQAALKIQSWTVPQYIEEGLIDQVLERGPTWRDPSTGERAVATAAPRTFAEHFEAASDQAHGGTDGHHGS